jgi:hypothetical protein
MNLIKLDDEKRKVRELEWQNFYDYNTQTLHANWNEGFFSNATTALWAITDLAFEGTAPKQICCSRGWNKYCDRSVGGNLDLYPIFFQPDIHAIDELWLHHPRFVHGRHVSAKTERWHPFVKRWFNPSDRVMEKVEKYSKEYHFDPQKTIGVFYRGTDKKFEIPISDFQKYRRVIKFLLKKNPESRILIQTDQEQFRDYLIGLFGSKCFYLEEMPVAKGSAGLHFLSDEDLKIDRVEYGVRVLAATYLMSQCKALINCTGNMALWMTFYRGHTNDMYQFDENAVCSDPLGRNFSDNFFVRGYRFLKNKYQKSSRKCSEYFARGVCDIALEVKDKTPVAVKEAILNNSGNHFKNLYINLKKFFINCRDKPNPVASPGTAAWWYESPIYFYPKDGRYPRAHAHDNFGRFREIISDPLNLLIERVPEAGYVQDGLVTLHNGVKVPFSGAQAYYEGFSSVFIFNRGVHEPLEEFVFQSLLERLPADSLMIELGAYWGHYSMWFKKAIPSGRVLLVEPESRNLEVGRRNFDQNGLKGEFLQSLVGHGHFSVDGFLKDREIPRLNLLHSDIQGYELEMLDGAVESLGAGRLDYVFISTHTQNLHEEVIDRLLSHDYRVEVSSGYDEETTSFDGLVFASNKRLEPVFREFKPMGRLEILKSNKDERVQYLNKVLAQIKQH